MLALIHLASDKLLKWCRLSESVEAASLQPFSSISTHIVNCMLGPTAPTHLDHLVGQNRQESKRQARNEC